MNRRDFLKYATASVLGMAFPTLLDESHVSAGEFSGFEPPIYKRFLQFTEYEPCPSIEDIVIHHSGFADGRDSTAEKIHKFHQEVNGWAGIGYHYFIRKDGMIEQGRLPHMVGAHAYHHNLTSIGICMSGNFEFQKPTEYQMEAIKMLVAWLCRTNDLDPMKKGVIVGHRDVGDTRCPGEYLYRRLDEIRRDQTYR